MSHQLYGSFAMKLRNLLISVLTMCATLGAPAQSALGQDAPQCTLDQISEALNNLDCTVNGAFISAASLVQTITTACEPTPDAETCHACFRKLGGKTGPALKALAKVKILPKKTASEFRIALVTAEETTCSAKEDLEESEDEDEDRSALRPPSPPQFPGWGQNRGRGRGRSGTFGRTRNL